MRFQRLLFLRHFYVLQALSPNENDECDQYGRCHHPIIERSIDQPIVRTIHNYPTPLIVNKLRWVNCREVQFKRICAISKPQAGPKQAQGCLPNRPAGRNGAATGNALLLEPSRLNHADQTATRLLALAQAFDDRAEILPPVILNRGGVPYVAVAVVRLQMR